MGNGRTLGCRKRIKVFAMHSLLLRMGRISHVAVLELSLVGIAIAGCNEQRTSDNSGILPGPYVVASGDNLSSIAVRAYGDAKLWSPLLNANRQVALRPRFRLEVGETITVPLKKDLDRSF